MGRPDPSLDEEDRKLCRHTWMCIPYVRALGGVTRLLFSAPMYMSYHGRFAESIREYLIDNITETAALGGRRFLNRAEVDRFAQSAARAVAGARPFDTELPWEQTGTCI